MYGTQAFLSSSLTPNTENPIPYRGNKCRENFRQGKFTSGSGRIMDEFLSQSNFALVMMRKEGSGRVVLNTCYNGRRKTSLQCDPGTFVTQTLQNWYTFFFL